MTREEFDKLSKKEIIEAMDRLVKHPSWEIFKFIIEVDINGLREKLLTGGFETLEEVKATQQHLTLLENIIYTPEAELAERELLPEDERS